MKKWGIITLVAATAIVSATAASAATKLTLIVNGQVSNAETKLIDGVTYVPLRAVSELLGANVDFNADTNTIQITEKDAAPVDVYKVGNFVFTQLQVEDGQFGWDVGVEVSNSSSVNKTINFTAVFYDINGKRLGSGFGNASLAPGESKFAHIVTNDDLTGYASAKFQIDVELNQ